MPERKQAENAPSLPVGTRDSGTARGGSKSNAFERWLMRQILAATGNPPVILQLWDGSRAPSPSLAEDPVARIEICDRRTLYSLLFSPALAFGDGVSAGRIRIHGDAIAFIEASYRLMKSASKSRAPGFLSRLARRGFGGRGDTRSNVHHHYDIGNEFYRLWLDEEMVYTCAYFEREDATLEEAQRAKMDRICRKLDLKPGQHVLEVGSGWGALAIHMARDYGVHVRAVDLSREPIRFARERVATLELANRVEIVEDDFRNVAGTYDAFVAIEMVEHLGVAGYRSFGEVAARSLKPDGRGLIQVTGRNAPGASDPWIEKRIFPGNYTPSLAEASVIFEPHDLSILDIENQRLHYALTCQAWLDRFIAASDRVAELYDADFVRTWRFYLEGSVAAFRMGDMQLFQVLFAPGPSNAVPMIRRGG